MKQFSNVDISQTPPHLLHHKYYVIFSSCISTLCLYVNVNANRKRGELKERERVHPDGTVDRQGGLVWCKESNCLCEEIKHNRILQEKV